MVVWKINSVPTAKDSSDRNMFSTIFHGILYALQPTATSSPCIELLFLHNHTPNISLYIIFRDGGNYKNAEQIEAQLSGAGYNLETISKGETVALLGQMKALLSEETYCVIKTEKVVTTPFLQEGYYYWSDPIISKGAECAPEQLAALFHSLFQCDEAAVSFQLFPTSIEPYENDSLQYLTAFLSSHVQMGNAYYAGTYEPYAKPAYDSYRYYASSNQPLFLYNILISASSGNAKHIATQFISSVQSISSNNPNL